MSNFNVGDVVYLKSGGPAMTVHRLIDDRENVECKWFQDDELEVSIFTQGSLTKENPKPRQKPMAG